MSGIKKTLLHIVTITTLAAAGFFVVNTWPGHAETKIDTVRLIPHKAIYDFKLKSLSSDAGLSGIDGQMYFEQDDLCDAWTTDHRFNATYYYPEQRGVKSNSHFIAWEAKDGSRFQFNSERSEGDAPPEQLRGYIQRQSADDTKTNDKAIYIRPADLTFDLKDGTLLPSAHTAEMIRQARQGTRFFNAPVFDGTDAEGPIEINTFIGAAVTAEELAGVKKKITAPEALALLVPQAWHVKMTTFLESAQEDMTPLYTMDFILHGNGVISYGVIDYGEFSVEQIMTSLEPLPARGCPPQETP